MKRRGMFLLAGCVSLCPTGAGAQAVGAQAIGAQVGGTQAAGTPDRTFPAPNRAIVLTVSKDVFYDTNVARGNETAARLRGIRNEDVRVTPTASLDMTLPRGRALLTVRGSIGYDAYARNERLNRERVSLRTRAALPLAFCQLAPGAAFERRQIDLADVSIIANVNEASGTTVQTYREAEGVLACGPEIGFRPGAYIRYASNRIEGSRRRRQDVEEVRYGSQLNYVHPSVGIVGLFAQRRDFTYDRWEPLLFGNASKVSVSNAGLRLDRRLGARLQLAGTISYADFSSSARLPGAKNFDGLNWDASATLRIGGRILLIAGSDRTITVLPGFAAEAVRQTNHTGSISYALTPLLRVGVSATRADRDFRLDPSRIGLAITRDRLDTATVRLEYNRRRMSFGLRGSYQRRNSDNDLFDYKGAQAMLSVSYLFNR